MTGGWVEQAASVRFADVASHLGIAQVRGHTIAPCPNPACGATRRGSGDPRGAVDLADRDGRELWHCKRCNTGGDAFAAVCFVLGGARFSALTPDDKARVRAWYADRGWCDAADGYVRPEVVPAPTARRMAEDAVQRAPEYPPEAEVARFWDLCSRIATDPVAAGDDPWPALYMRDRGLDADQLSGAMDVVRATPIYLPRWPAWWPGWISEGDGPHWAMFRLVVRAYDATGAVRSIHARRVLRYRTFTYSGELFSDPLCEACRGTLDRERGRAKEKCPACGWMPKPKTLWPVKCSSERLLFADAGGVAVLKGDASAPKDVLIVEGLTDTLRGATVAPSVPCAVIGFTSGGAQALADVRWRRDMRLGVATDDDAAGDAYAEQVADAVRPLGISMRRIRWASLMGGAGK